MGDKSTPKRPAGRSASPGKTGPGRATANKNARKTRLPAKGDIGKPAQREATEASAEKTVANEVFSEWVSGRPCVTCAIVRRDVVVFGLERSYREEEANLDVRCFYLIHYLEHQDGTGARSRDRGVRFKGGRARMEVNPHTRELLTVFEDGNVFHHTEQGGRSEKMISQDDVRLLRSIRYIGGRFYVAGCLRGVLRREGPESWTCLSRDIKIDPHRDVSALDHGFGAIDGFSESDIYAAGGKGDVWRYDGNRWRQIHVPTKANLTSICCASDGMVYLGGDNHLILQGRADRWKILHEDRSGKEFAQLMEYDGRLLAVDTVDYGRLHGSKLYAISDGRVAPMDRGDRLHPPTSCRCLAAGHGMLLAAGYEAASLFDGRRWRILFGVREPEGPQDEEPPLVRLLKAGRAIEDLRRKLDRD